MNAAPGDWQEQEVVFVEGSPWIDKQCCTDKGRRSFQEGVAIYAKAWNGQQQDIYVCNTYACIYVCVFCISMYALYLLHMHCI